MGRSRNSSGGLQELSSLVLLALLVGQVHGCAFANQRQLLSENSDAEPASESSTAGEDSDAAVVDARENPVDSDQVPFTSESFSDGVVDARDIAQGLPDDLLFSGGSSSLPDNATEGLRRSLTVGAPSMQITCSLATMSTINFNQIDASETDPNEVWAIDTNKQVWKWQGGSSWYTPQTNWFALSISVGKFGCYMVGLDNAIYKWGGTRFVAVGGPDAGWGAKWKWISTGNQIWVVGAGDSRLFYKNDDDWTKPFTYANFAANYVENSLEGEVWATQSGQVSTTTTSQPACYWGNCFFFFLCKYVCPPAVTTTTTSFGNGNSYRRNPANGNFDHNGNTFQITFGSSGLFSVSLNSANYWTGKEWQSLAPISAGVNGGGFASSGASGFWVTQSGKGVQNCVPTPNTRYAAPSPYQLEAFVDYPWNDISSSHGKSILECQSDCDKEPRCVAVLMDSIKGGGWCWLKHTLGHPNNHVSRWVYRKTGFYLETAFDFPGNNLQSLAGRTTAQCLDACRANDACVAATLDSPSSGGCSTKSRLVGPVPNTSPGRWNWKRASKQTPVCLPVDNYKPFPRGALTYTTAMKDCFFKRVKDLVPKYKERAADLLRLAFHDAAPLAADGSVFFNDERYHPNNARLEGIEETMAIQRAVSSSCPFDPSFADTLQVATAVMQWATQPSPRNGDYMDLQTNARFKLGRPDSATDNGPHKLPGATMSAAQLIANFKSNFRLPNDVVAAKTLVLLSAGGHTIGNAACVTFNERRPVGAPNVDISYGAGLRTKCPGGKALECTKVELDTTTETVFDNQYFNNLKQKKGLLTSDQNLWDGGNQVTRDLVNKYSLDNTAFLIDYMTEFIAMSQNGVTAKLTP